MKHEKYDLLIDTGAGCSAAFTWPPGTGKVEIRFRSASGQEIRRVRGPWRRESINRCDAQVREAVLSAVRTHRCPSWASDFVQIREAGHKPTLLDQVGDRF